MSASRALLSLSLVGGLWLPGCGDDTGGSQGSTGTVVNLNGSPSLTPTPADGGGLPTGTADAAGDATDGQSTGGSTAGTGDASSPLEAGAGLDAAGSQDAGAGALDAGAKTAARAIADPPTYMGNGSGGCTTVRSTLGHEPDDPAGTKHPLFLYFVGTTFSSSDVSARYDSQAASAVTEAMARRGFVALSVEYDNTISLSPDKVSCVFGDGAESARQVACARANVDCDLGIATWGHSQGAFMAHVASDYDARLRAVWTTGYSGGSHALADDRLRVVNGEADTMNSNWSTLHQAAGTDPAQCPDDGRSECLRPDGSGWIIVRASDCVESSADHCWFDRTSCSTNAITLEPNWIDAQSTQAFALEANADWVAATVRR